MTTLDEYLDLASRQRWRWGALPAGDCVQFGLGWASARIGRPLAAPLAYRDAAMAKAFLEAHGGLVGVVSEWMRANGFAPTAEPDDGDIGVAPMAAPFPNGELAEDGFEYGIARGSVVIRRSGWWIGKALRGYASASAEGIPAWRIK